MLALRFACWTGLLVGLAVSPLQACAEDYGTIKGRFVLDGDVPKVEFLIKDGKRTEDGAVPKNPKVCAAKDLPSDALIIDPKHKGIGNVFSGAYLGASGTGALGGERETCERDRV